MGFFSDLKDTLTGSGARDAARDAGNAMLEANKNAQNEINSAYGNASAMYDPYAQLGQRGLDNQDILFDSQAQYDFLQNNPLFQMSLDNANTTTSKMAAAKGRLNAGDTLQQLSNNVLLASQPLLDRHQNNIKGAINTGVGVTGAQSQLEAMRGGNLAGLMTGAGNIEANKVQGVWDARANGLGGKLGSMGQSMLLQGIQGGMGNIGGTGGFSSGFGQPFGFSTTAPTPMNTGAYSPSSFVNRNMGVFGSMP